MNFFFFSSRRRHTRFKCDWSSDVCSSDLVKARDDAAIEILDLAPLRNLKAAEREGDAGGHVVSVKRRGVERVGPVGLVDGEAVGPAAVEAIGIERHLVPATRVEIPPRAPEPPPPPPASTPP